VSSGIYYEYLVINKKLALVGEGETSIIDGKGTAYIIQVRVGDTSIDGFTIRNGTRCGILIDRANDVKILNNLIRDIPRSSGIFLSESTRANIISNSIIDTRDGILMGYSHNNTLKWNTITGEGHLGGVGLRHSGHNQVLGNNISSGEIGISLMDARSNTIKRNEVSCCSDGIGVSNGINNLIIQNTISENEWGIYLYATTEDNEIYHNNFISNLVQAETLTPDNIWHNSEYEGNYWDNYTGIDLDDDGIGDMMLPHQGVDNYPLIDPWSTLAADLTFDNRVDLFDIITVASVYRIRESESKWLQQADLAPPWGIIDIFDIVTVASYYGQQH
jgi:parallel beta-helix repeat protein